MRGNGVLLLQEAKVNEIAPPECSSLGQQSEVCCGLQLEWAKVTFTAIIPLLLLFHGK